MIFALGLILFCGMTCAIACMAAYVGINKL